MRGNSLRDPELARMAEIAHDLDAKMYQGGWVQLVNYDNPEQGAYPFTKNTWTTVADIVSPQRAVIPANTLHVGSILRAQAWGSIVSTAGTATFTPSFYWNGAASGVALCTGAAQTPATTTVFTWQAELRMTITAVGGTPPGATSTAWASAVLQGWSATNTTNILIPNSAPASATIATNAAGWVTMAAACSASAAGNQIVTYGFTVEYMN